MTETPYGPTEAGAVVLEIGAGTGALVVCAPAELAGREIEISPAHQPGQRRHACIRERRGGGAISYAAIYDRLPPARYTIWHDRLTSVATITVTGGQVTSYDWPDRAGRACTSASSAAVQLSQ
jgi:hypothetical protein